jgi:V-type H+-transporting ATPase subunit F
MSNLDLTELVLFIQDTCTGFLLGGIGEINDKRQKNFFVVTKGNNLVESYFNNFFILRENVI